MDSGLLCLGGLCLLLDDALTDEVPRVQHLNRHPGFHNPWPRVVHSAGHQCPMRGVQALRLQVLIWQCR